MSFEEYQHKKIQLLDIAAPAIVGFHKKSKRQQFFAILDGTGSNYLAEKWEGVDFAHRYLNSDGDNKILWLKMMGVMDATNTDCEVFRNVMIYFYNHSIDTVLSNDFIKRHRLNAFGNGLNWCKAWLKLSDDAKVLAVKQFVNK